MLNRRNFLQVTSSAAVLGSLGIANADTLSSNKSVILVYLGGGPSQYELTSPNPEAIEEYRSVTGVVDTNVAGLQLGGNYHKIATIADKFSIVRSFGHNDASHGSATHYMMTGFERGDRSDDTAPPDFPSRGSVVSALYGPNATNGMPHYIGVGRVYSDGPSWLNKAFSPYENSGDAVRNLSIRIDSTRFSDRKALLRTVAGGALSDRSGNAATLEEFQKQVYGLLEGNTKDRFELDKESEGVRQKYGKSSIGNQLLMARRLVEGGSKFILATQGGFDVHTDILNQHNRLDADLDRALYGLITDLHERGLNKDVLVIVTGEFGRTKLVKSQLPNGGRNHFPQVTPLILAGGSYNHGQVIGKHDKNATQVVDKKHGPGDLNATIFSFLGIDEKVQKLDNAGRPRYFIPEGSHSIL